MRQGDHDCSIGKAAAAVIDIIIVGGGGGGGSGGVAGAGVVVVESDCAWFKHGGNATACNKKKVRTSKTDVVGFMMRV